MSDTKNGPALYAFFETAIAVGLAALVSAVPTALLVLGFSLGFDREWGTMDMTLYSDEDASSPQELLAGMLEEFPGYQITLTETEDEVGLFIETPVGSNIEGGEFNATLKRYGYSPKSVTSSRRNPLTTSLMDGSMMDRVSEMSAGRMTAFVATMIAVSSLAVMLVAVAMILLLKMPENWVPFGTFPQKLGAGIGLGLVALPITFGISLVQALLGVDMQEQEVFVKAFAPENGYRWALIPLIVLLGPLAEELFFRRLIFARFAMRGWIGLGYAVSALLFACAHFNPTAFVGYVVLGLIFSWAYMQWKSVLVPFLAHATYNLLVAIVYLSFGV